MKLEINPVSGEAVQAILQDVYQTPKSIAAAVADILNRSRAQGVDQLPVSAEATPCP